jgi:hypothetical protein
MVTRVLNPLKTLQSSSTGEQYQQIKIELEKKLKADEIKGTPAIRSRIFCLPVFYLEIQILKHT